MNRLEELLFSTLIISILIVLNIAFAFTDNGIADKQISPLEIYLEIQDAYLDGRRPQPGARDIYIVITLNNTVVYEYGDPNIRAGGYPVRYPIILNGSMGELYCWVVEGG